MGNRVGRNTNIGDLNIDVSRTARLPGLRNPVARGPGYRVPGYHAGWHHGHWHAHYHGAGHRLGYWWNRYPVAATIGLTTWAVHRAGWVWGYYYYTNPYVVAGAPVVVYDYSEPLIVSVETVSADSETGEAATDAGAADTAADSDVSTQALETFDKAREQFHAGQYEQALESVNAAIQEMPNDAAFHEFRALVLFAMGNYAEAAATLHAVLSAGPGWDWTTMSSLYPDVDTYTKQLRALEDARKKNESDPAAHLVLGYHYLCAGHNENAAGVLTRLVQLTPQDSLAVDLLAQADPQAELPQSKDKEASHPPENSVTLAAADIQGSWTAKRGENDTFELKLADSGTFTWTYSVQGKQEDLKGQWSLEDEGVLVMDTGEQGKLLAQLIPDSGKQSMDFYLIGDTEETPPLQFQRVQ